MMGILVEYALNGKFLVDSAGQLSWMKKCVACQENMAHIKAMSDFLHFKKNVGNSIAQMKILYVEDEEDIRANLARIIGRRTKHIILASNGQEGLKLYKKERPDIIITDIRMPVMDGLSMLEKIRKNDPFVPVIVTTGNNDEKFFLRTIELGVDKYIKKPVESKELIPAIGKVADMVLQDRQIELKNRFIVALLDINPTYLAVFGDSLTYLNESFKRFLGISDVDGFKKRYGQFVSIIEDRDPLLVDDSMLGRWAAEKEKTQGSLVVKLHVDNAEPQTMLVSTVYVPGNQEYLIVFTDVTHIEEEKKHYQFLAEYDGLTKIYNRSKISKEAEKELLRVKRYKMPFSILLFDIDHFKKVNDTHGHQAGDVVLMIFADLIKNMVRETDIFGRYGGEEFILLMPSTPAGHAISIAERLCRAVEAYKFPGVGKVTVSIGVAQYNEGDNLDLFVKRADSALYEAKSQGRNQVKMAD